MDRIRVGLVGISGYAGMELARLLASHRHFELTMACSRAEAGRRLESFYPFLCHLPGGDVEISVYDPDSASDCSLVFLAVPAGTAMKMAPELLERGIKVVDFSADFRLRDVATYGAWYGQHTAPELLNQAVYGLPELYAERIAEASLIANPGCYPTASILGLFAALKHDLIHPDTVIIDAASGATGAGRKAQIPTLFCELSDNFRAYSVPRHRHTPEIEQELGVITGSRPVITFTPHIVPMKRGILATVYAKLKDASLEAEAIHAMFADTWRDCPWIRVLSPGALPETAHVRGSMYCDVSVAVDKRTGRLIILSAIDNLCRGASGQALACANLMCGLPVSCGLEDMAPLP